MVHAHVHPRPPDEAGEGEPGRAVAQVVGEQRGRTSARARVAAREARGAWCAQVVGDIVRYLLHASHQVLDAIQHVIEIFHQQVEDDLLMIKTLNDMEIDKLITQINSVLDEFFPELSKPVFDAQSIPMKDTEKIWNEIIQQQNAKS